MNTKLVTEFVKKSGSNIFGKDFNYFNVLIESKKSDDYDDHIDEFNKAAKSFKKEVKFVFIDTDIEENWQVIEYLGIIAEEIPTILFIKIQNGLIKYKFSWNEITKANIVSFTESCLNGNEIAFLKTEEIADDWDRKPLKILVGKNFENVVFDKMKTSFVFFYAPWCSACQAVMAEIEKLAEFYHSNDEIMIAKIDSTENEVHGLPIFDVPTIALFVRGSRKPIYYTEDERTAKKFSEFIISNTKANNKKKIEEKSNKEKLIFSEDKITKDDAKTKLSTDNDKTKTTSKKKSNEEMDRKKSEEKREDEEKMKDTSKTTKDSGKSSKKPGKSKKLSSCSKSKKDEL
ncbi:unnamed protein product [Dracunculus medinensis]|uniref:Thioredoxin domain-containing protein n=1 Tax=Dracunculus medinensis TaxID=318479 RepID=A0A0N4UE22_DRAME|nr:unnamed protein product [Dracunculus medinensis]